MRLRDDDGVGDVHVKDGDLPCRSAGEQYVTVQGTSKVECDLDKVIVHKESKSFLRKL